MPKEYLGMNMSPNDHHEAKTSELGAAAVGCIELGSNDHKLESGSSTAENVKDDDGIQNGKVSAVDNNGGDTEHKDVKNSNLRPRRKSKYLSPPFTDLIKGKPSKESESPGDKSIQKNSSPSIVKCSRKKKQPTKSIASLAPANLETITASSAELLLQLHIVACDTSKPYYSKGCDPVKLFFNRFRASVFCSLSIEEQKRADKRVSQKKDKTQVKKMGKEKDMTESDKKAPSGLCGVMLDFSSNSPLMVNDHQLGCSPISSNIKPQRKRKRKVEPVENPGASQTTQIPDLNCDSATLDPLQVTSQMTSQEETKIEPEKKKRKKKKTITPVTNMLSTPYLNGNSVKQISLEMCLQDSGPYLCSASAGMNSISNSNVVSPPGFCAKVSTPSKPTPPVKSEPVEKVNTVIGFDPNSKSSSPLQNSQSSSGMSLDQMKQSLEFMTSMLEKSGDMISPVMRANLEKEIKNLLKKVDPMIRSSS